MQSLHVVVGGGYACQVRREVAAMSCVGVSSVGRPIREGVVTCPLVAANLRTPDIASTRDDRMQC